MGIIGFHIIETAVGIMTISFPNPIIARIYRYIKLNDGQNILYKDIMEELNISYPTIRKYIAWLERRDLIEKSGKRITLLN